MTALREIKLLQELKHLNVIVRRILLLRYGYALVLFSVGCICYAAHFGDMHSYEQPSDLACVVREMAIVNIVVGITRRLCRTQQRQYGVGILYN